MSETSTQAVQLPWAVYQGASSNWSEIGILHEIMPAKAKARFASPRNLSNESQSLWIILSKGKKSFLVFLAKDISKILRRALKSGASHADCIDACSNMKLMKTYNESSDRDSYVLVDPSSVSTTLEEYEISGASKVTLEDLKEIGQLEDLA